MNPSNQDRPEPATPLPWDYWPFRKDHTDAVYAQYAANRLPDLEEENRRLKKQLNQPETQNFQKGIVLEAAHQRERWGIEHDQRKTDADWYWNLGYLAGKVMHKTGDHDKINHWIISCAAMCANWHYYRNKNGGDK